MSAIADAGRVALTDTSGEHADASAARLVVGVGIACLALRAVMEGGLLPNPILPFVTSSSLFCFLVVPAATLARLGYRPLAYFGLGRTEQVLRPFLVGVAAVVVSAVALASLPSFRAAYGTQPTLDFCVSLLVGMACMEFFFRGFLLLPLYEAWGRTAIGLALVPYVLLHVGKPTLELAASIPFGLWLSSFAIRSRSVAYGIVLHWLLALALNLATAR